jgi:PilZ domain-containing protein
VTPPPSTKPAVPPQIKTGGAAQRAQTAEERRRAQRVMLRMTVKVHLPGKPEALHATTVTVSETGGMLVMKDQLPMGAKLTVENPRTQKTVEAHVVRPAQQTAEGAQIPVEFTTPSPNFWGVFFPPAAS